jgi:hypothetical protein
MWGIPKSDSGTIILVIADHLEWGNKTLQAEHLLALQRKINGYIAFIEGGEIYNKIPAALGKSLVILVYGKHEVSERGELFFERVAELLRAVGIGFEFVFKAD